MHDGQVLATSLDKSSARAKASALERAFTPVLVRAALAGDRRASEHLIDLASRVIGARVARSLARLETRHALQLEATDLVQDILLQLYEKNGHVLRQWNPERGLSLKNWIGLVAQRHLRKRLRAAPEIADVDLDQLLLQSEAVRIDEAWSLLETRDALFRLLAALERTLSRNALIVFTSLCTEDADARVIAQRVGTTEQAVYTTRTRCRQLARELASSMP